MKVLTIAVAALALGFGLGWVTSPGPYRYFYKTTNELELLGDEGAVIGRVPAGTPLLADAKLVRAPDIGWWAYVPVQFDTMWDAQDLGVAPSRKVRSITEITLYANSSSSAAIDSGLRSGALPSTPPPPAN